MPFERGTGEVPWAGIDLVPLVDEGLGNSAYLVDLGDGRALVVDPRGTCARCRRGRRRRGLRDRVRRRHPPARRLPLRRARSSPPTDGATVLASAAGRPRVRRTRGLRRRRRGRPRRADAAGAGHARGTPHEHLSYLLLDGGAPVGVFTGGSLIVGSAARTDLIGAERTEELARAQYRSLQPPGRSCPDDMAVWPTHGAGSFCSAPPGAERTTTIGRERATNPLLAAPDEDAFVAALLGGARQLPALLRRASARSTAAARRCSTCAARQLAALDAVAGAHGCAPTAPPSSTSARSPTTPPDTSPGRCRSRCGRSSRPGWAGSRRPTRPLVVVRDADQDRRRDRLAGPEDRVRAASSASSTAASPPGPPPGNAVAATALVGPDAGRRRPGRSTSGSDASTPPGTCPARATSSSARSPSRPHDLPREPHRGDVRARRARDGRRQPARTRRAPTLDRAGRRTRGLGRAPPATPSRPAHEHRSARGRSAARAAAPTSPSSACSSRSTRSSAACSARNAPCCRCSPSDEFGLTAYTAALTFILAFGVTKAATNFVAGTLSDRYGRKPVLVAGWLSASRSRCC